MQTISPLRSGWRGRPPPPEVEACDGIPGAKSTGKIYYRTPLGYKALGNVVDVVSLLKVA
ncbi:uncharacterized protein B0I36DRAFT_322024 [Microdochium trichocladiopsis]|uniref:Uncharacterized protein n=1 Tax=Microdochium trichocladiopsis TaxID=1682393 RepID=A0A9P8Y568_9PEZI|nr:uncharacterized protein B0I36DRAFT_322024 [Microdochium trichocladiopsis]KAH7030551.1 hypothetical protein B0I36DRAFT_322024 [Microdochium trichocladiopsis]